MCCRPVMWFVLLFLLAACRPQGEAAPQGKNASQGGTSPHVEAPAAQAQGAQAPVVPASAQLGTAADGDWPQFRGPSGQGKTAAGLPLRWSKNQGVLWRVKLPGAGSSSPIVYQGRIYLVCYSGYAVPGQRGGRLQDLRRHLLALDARDGSLLWQKTVPARMPEQPHVRDHGYAANTPAADELGVYAFFGKSGVYAYDHQGRLRWKADVGSGTHGWGSGTSLVLAGELVLVNASVESGSLVALDRRTGRRRWQVRSVRESWNTPVVISAPSGRREVVLAVRGQVLAFDPASGNRLWQCRSNITWYIVPSVVEEGGIVFSLGGRSGVAAVAVRSGGQGDVTSSHRLWTSRKGSNVSSPVVHQGRLYWVHDQLGIAYCAEARSGRIVYEKRLPRAGQVYASALLAGDHLYYLNRRGTTYVVKVGPRFELVAQNDLGDGTRFDATPAVLGDKLLIRSQTTLYCIGR